MGEVKRYASRFAAGTESYRELSECFPEETDRGTEYVLASDYDALEMKWKQVSSTAIKYGLEIGALEAQVESLRSALTIAAQAIREVGHAQEVGANWYTRGADGLYRQVDMWVRKGRAACASALADPVGEMREAQSSNRKDTQPSGSVESGK